MPKESSIMRMDWKALGYWPVYKDGKLAWEKELKDGRSNSNTK